MPVDKRPTDRFHSDRDSANSSIRTQLRFILQPENRDLLKTAKNGQRHVVAMFEFWKKIKDGDEFTPAQRSYVDGMYEKVWSLKGEEAVDRKIDKKRKGMRFG